MKILKNTLIVSSYVLLVALFFGGGYAIGRIGVSDSVPTPMPTVAAVEEVNANDVKTTVYEVKVENGLLQINKCVGDNKTAILSEEISENGDVALQSDTERKVESFFRNGCNACKVFWISRCTDAHNGICANFSACLSNCHN